MPENRGPSEPPERRRREGRIRRHLRLAGEVRQDPKCLYPLLRKGFIDVWRSRGGGFYGLGYVVAFVCLEVVTIIGEALDSGGAGDFALGQILEYLLRLGLLSFVNVFQALLWPFFVLEHLGGAGIILLAAGFLGFEFLLKPLVERHVPELRNPVSPHPDQ
ncbi:MAG: hypothetical protein AB7I04_07480 [Pseudomonadales bacterium]